MGRVQVKDLTHTEYEYALLEEKIRKIEKLIGQDHPAYTIVKIKEILDAS